VAEYYGLLKSRNASQFYEMVLCANVIPKERRLFLEQIGIECKELGISLVSELAKKYDYTFIDDRPSFESSVPPASGDQPQAGTGSGDSEISVWLFQANPDRYDILNALSDGEIGNSMHWLVNQHKTKIRKGHLGLIWMSGIEAGIYALTRIESDPAIMEELPPERKYWSDTAEKETAMRVSMTVVRRFTNRPILKSTLIGLPGLQGLSILRQLQGTNFPVTDSEWRIIAQRM
jgi:EVE domain